MLRYAVLERKACAVVLGDSGLGKTLVGRLLFNFIRHSRPVGWLPGLSQPEDQTVVIAAAQNGPTADQELPLSQWLDAARRTSRAPVLIVDDADSLQQRHWQALTALVARGIDYWQPISIVLLGLPGLSDRLAQPDAIRLRRRVFRIVPLRPLTVDEVGEYIATRLSVAQAEREDFFTPEIVQQVARVTGGNPGLINQVCENALLEAYSDDRDHIVISDVLAGVCAMVGVTDPSVMEAALASGGASLFLTTTSSPANTPQTSEPDAATTPEPDQEPADPPAQPRFEDSFRARVHTLQARIGNALQAARRATAGLDDVTTLPAGSCSVRPTSAPADRVEPQPVDVPMTSDSGTA